MHVLAPILLATLAAQDSSADYRLVNPKAIELFERVPALMGWALVRFDSNGDGHLSIFEADKAALEFKRIADLDRDGRVTPAEFVTARDSFDGSR
jgi:hypothetical protein